MPNQSTPEIDRLRLHAADEGEPWYVPSVALEDAIQAVRDTEDRRTREIVGALRERSARSRAGADAGAGCWYEGAAAFIERTFLNGEATRDHS